MFAFPISRFDALDHSIALLQDMACPPVKCWLLKDLIGKCVFRDLDRMRFLQIL